MIQVLNVNHVRSKVREAASERLINLLVAIAVAKMRHVDQADRNWIDATTVRIRFVLLRVGRQERISLGYA